MLQIQMQPLWSLAIQMLPAMHLLIQTRLPSLVFQTLRSMLQMQLLIQIRLPLLVIRMLASTKIQI